MTHTRPLPRLTPVEGAFLCAVEGPTHCRDSYPSIF
jgi:hypothetical protein